jgi:hypothetical protein
MDGAQIDAVARHVRKPLARRARRRLHDDWNNGMAVADAVGQAVKEALTDLAARMDADEVPVDLTHGERYTVGLRGVRLNLTMLVATNRRLWHISHFDGAVTAVPLPMDRVTVRKKGLSPTIELEQSGAGWTVVGPKALVTWVEEMARGRPQAPVGLLAKVAPAPAPQAPPATWAADPAGRHELRYWDGTRWTEHVSDRGATARDPLP